LDNYSKIGSSTTCTLVVSSCPFNFYLINKDCAACPPGTTSSGGSASSCTAVTPTCASNEVLVDNVCQVCAGPCSSLFFPRLVSAVVLKRTRTVQCKAGFEKNNNICIQTACSSSEVRDQTSQLCVPVRLFPSFLPLSLDNLLPTTNYLLCICLVPSRLYVHQWPLLSHLRQGLYPQPNLKHLRREPSALLSHLSLH
jgi:hypothetical protein